MDLIGTAHDQVADAGNDHRPNAVGKAVLQHQVALMAVHVKQEQCLYIRAGQHIFQVVFYGMVTELISHMEVPVHQPGIHGVLQAGLGAPDNDGALFSVRRVIPSDRDAEPDICQYELGDKDCQYRPYRRHPAVQEDDDNEHEKIGKEARQCLGIEKIRLFMVGHLERIVHPAEYIIDRDKQQHHVEVALEVERLVHLIGICPEPGKTKKSRHQDNVDQGAEADDQVMVGLDNRFLIFITINHEYLLANHII